MFKNYFKTAWRNLLRNKFYSAINIAGLAIGLAVGILILLWVQDEMSYDTFHHNANNIYKINSHIGSGTSTQIWERSPAPLAIFSKQIPEIKSTVRIQEADDKIRFAYQDKKFEESNIAFVDDNFFSFFDFKILQGNQTKPFANNNSILITSSEANKYFGTGNAIGKVLSTKDYGSFTVSGVMQNFPHNSSLQYDMLLPMSLYSTIFTARGGNGGWKTINEDLGSYNFKTFLQLRSDASVQTVGNKLSELYRDKKGAGSNKDDFFSLQSLSTLHLIAADGNNNALQMVRTFLVIAVLILLIACINYVNLSTARSMLRAKEVSIRKIMGAEKHQLFIQFIIETAVLFLLASLLAFIIIYLLLPLYNTLSGKQLAFSVNDGNVWLVIGSTIVATLLLAGLYPALLLSSFQPVAALKGKLSLGLRTTSFRKALVVSQFIVSVVLITGTVVITKQLQYVKERDLGYNKNQVFSIALTNEATKHYDAIRTDIAKQPGIVDVATASYNIVGVHNTTGDTNWDGDPENNTFLIHANYIDEKLIPLLKMKMVAGANFIGSPADSTHFILNEMAVKQAGITNPIGKRFQIWQTKGIITGVVKDFNYTSLKQSVEPTIFLYSPFNITLFVRTTGKAAPQAIAAAQKIWKQYDAETPFQYSFLDDDYNKLYAADEKMSDLINTFAAIAILLSCLGLFGLIAFTAQVKTKEIGIRKVLGADVFNITTLLGKEFMVLVTIAFVIASPLAWLALNKWLQSFAYRIPLQSWMFLVSGCIAFLIALITVSFRAIKAAIANPVKSLRTE